MERSISAARVATLLGPALDRSPAYVGLADGLRMLISDGRITVTSVIIPLRCTLKVITTRPRILIAAIGTNQLRRTCETKRRIHGPNSTPLVSNWSGPNSCV